VTPIAVSPVGRAVRSTCRTPWTAVDCRSAVIGNGRAMVSPSMMTRRCVCGDYGSDIVGASIALHDSAATPDVSVAA